MNVKIERLNNNFQQVISEILHEEVKDPNLKFVTITGCEITNDLSFAKVYFTVLDDSKKDEIIKSLDKAKSFIRGQISQRVEIRHTPEIRFVFDESIEYGNKIEKILNDINNKE